MRKTLRHSLNRTHVEWVRNRLHKAIALAKTNSGIAFWESPIANKAERTEIKQILTELQKSDPLATRWIDGISVSKTYVIVWLWRGAQRA